MKQHLIDVEKVFQCLDRVNLKVNVEKCKFAMSQVRVLGHIVNEHGILPKPEKVKVIQNLSLPTNVTGV